jgi:phosphoglycerate dehydrogenase-like enzyme
MQGESAFENAIGHIDGLVVRTYTTVDTALLDRAHRLRAVGRAGVGLDNIDQDACRARKIAVFNTPDANTTAVAEYVFSLIFNQFRPLTDSIASQCTLPEWETLRIDALAPRELNELTLGIVGFGRIGSRVGHIAAALGMTVLYHDLLSIAPPAGCTQTDLTRVLAEADILTLHVDGRSSNRHLFAADQFDRLKPDATLINTSRGLVVDERALAAWLNKHPRATALLDVHNTEPIQHGHPLLSAPNASLYPHVAAATRSAKERMGWVVRDVWNQLKNET